MQTIAQQTMSLDQAETRIQHAIARKDEATLTRIANQLRAATWAGQVDIDRAKRLMRNARKARDSIRAAQVPKKRRKKESDGSSDG